MIVVVAILLGLVLGILTGGSLRALRHVHIQGEWVLLGSPLLQLLVPSLVSRFGWPAVLLLPLWLASFGATVTVALLNARLPGFGAVAVGAAMNFAAILRNGAMPVSISAMLDAGYPGNPITAFASQDWASHSPLGTTTEFSILTDIMPVPVGGFLQGVVSIGDVLLVVGVVAFLVSVVQADRAPSLIP